METKPVYVIIKTERQYELATVGPFDAVSYGIADGVASIKLGDEEITVDNALGFVNRFALARE